jgi:hypothetical protein
MHHRLLYRQSREHRDYYFLFSVAMKHVFMTLKIDLFDAWNLPLENCGKFRLYSSQKSELIGRHLNALDNLVRIRKPVADVSYYFLSLRDPEA